MTMMMGGPQVTVARKKHTRNQVRIGMNILLYSVAKKKVLRVFLFISILTRVTFFW